MLVGPTLLHQLQQRCIEMMEAELRTEALLLGEEYYEATPALTKLIRSVKPVSVRRSVRLDSWEDALRYSLLYGTSMQSMQSLSFRPAQAAISGWNPDVCVLDDIDFSKNEEMIMQRARTYSKPQMFAQAYGAGDIYLPEPVPVATLPRASMVWPASHQGKKGPAPHKPFRKK